MSDWLQSHLPDGWGTTEFVVLAVSLTVATFILSIAVVAFVVVRLPANYFLGDAPPRAWAKRHPLVRWPLWIGMHALGVLLILLGIVMSFPGVPGQGILTILLGVMLISFPGKRRFEKWLLRRRGVLKTINKFRSRYGREPLQVDAPMPTP
jgi:hypothetical protein